MCFGFFFFLQNTGSQLCLIRFFPFLFFYTTHTRARAHTHTHTHTHARTHTRTHTHTHTAVCSLYHDTTAPPVVFSGPSRLLVNSSPQYPTLWYGSQSKRQRGLIYIRACLPPKRRLAGVDRCRENVFLIDTLSRAVSHTTVLVWMEMVARSTISASNGLLFSLLHEKRCRWRFGSIVCVTEGEK